MNSDDFCTQAETNQIADWWNFKSQLSQIKPVELSKRRAIRESIFGHILKSGTYRKNIGPRHKVTLSFENNPKITNEDNVSWVIGQLLNSPDAFIAKSVFEWNLQLKVTLDELSSILKQIPHGEAIHGYIFSYVPKVNLAVYEELSERGKLISASAITLHDFTPRIDISERFR